MNVNDVLDGHVGLDLDCVDRLYLNAYVPNLRVGGQVVSFWRAWVEIMARSSLLCCGRHAGGTGWSFAPVTSWSP